MTREEQILHAALEAGKQPRPTGKIWNSPLGRRVMSAYEIGFLDGAEWVDEHPKPLWHDAQGDYLPEIDREVIVLCENGQIAFGHRPNPDGEVWKHPDETLEHVYFETYGKGGWNIPDVRWWLDVSIPNLEE